MQPGYNPIQTQVAQSTPSVIPPIATSDTKDHFWRTIIVFILIVAGLRLFVIDPFLVHGNSMDPTFHDGNYVIVDKFTYNISNPSRGDIIVFKAPTEDGRYFIKRIIGLPGERIVVEGSVVQIYNPENPNGFVIYEPYVVHESGRKADRTLKEDEYFVMGDNREVSSDSRSWGALDKTAITGRALLRLLPVSDVSLLPGNKADFEDITYPEDGARSQRNSEIPANPGTSS